MTIFMIKSIIFITIDLFEIDYKSIIIIANIYISKIT